MLAQRAKNPEFTDMLLNGDKKLGTDGHSLSMKAVNRAHKKHGLPLIGRGKAKNYNFGWKFGAQDPKLGEMGGGDATAGADIRAELEGVFPAQAALVEALTAEWRSNAEVTEKWGKKRYKNGWIRGLDGRPIFIQAEHTILVFMLQSDEAITMAAAYIILYKRLMKKYKWGVDWAYVCWYHDEYTIECREELADDIKIMAEQAIVDAGKFFGLTHCPQVGEAEVGRNWYDIH
jgi:DNA polymerase I-like protein with 3'-5' exonuclease and polymerase domains